MGKVRCRADKEDSIAVNKAGDIGELDLVFWSGTVDQVYFDAKVLSCFSKSSVCGFWQNSVNISA